jgi:Xaa-Pro aminopeptidase
VGATETAVLEVLVDQLVGDGADYLPFLCLGAGPNVFHAHPKAGDYVIRSGDLLACDVGGRFRGYYSDIARTAVVGEATSHQAEAYGTLWKIHEQVIAEIRPGVRASDLYWLCRDAFEHRGMTLGLSHIGHSVGLGLHESPMICPTDDTELREGMTINIEPAVRDETGAYHVEDLVEVTAAGSRVLSRWADWSTLLEVG